MKKIDDFLLGRFFQPIVDYSALKCHKDSLALAEISLRWNTASFIVLAFACLYFSTTSAQFLSALIWSFISIVLVYMMNHQEYWTIRALERNIQLNIVPDIAHLRDHNLNSIDRWLKLTLHLIFLVLLLRTVPHVPIWIKICCSLSIIGSVMCIPYLRSCIPANSEGVPMSSRARVTEDLLR